MRCVSQILSGVATGFALHKQLPSYEDLACSNSLPVIAHSVGVLYKSLKITLF